MKNILKKSNFLFLLFFVLFLLLPHEVKAEDASTIPVKISVTYGQTEARRIFKMINDMRSSPEDAWYWCGREKQPCPDLKPLQYDYDLEQIAMRRAAEIALSFSHARPNGKLYYTAYDILLLTNSENIAAGSTTAEGANRQWREDDANDTGQAHRRTMLSDEYNCVGIAHVTYNGYHYWVEEFAYRPNVNTQSTTAVNTPQTVTLDVKTTKIENFGVVFNQDKYLLKKGETTPVSIKQTYLSVYGHRPYWDVSPVLDTPSISVADPKIVRYQNGITGLSEGSTSFTASLYGLSFTSDPIIIVHTCGKNWGNGTVTQSPTCTKPGEKLYICTICKKTKTEAIAATGHTWGNSKVTKQPTLKSTGVKTYTCKKCGATKKVTIAKLKPLKAGRTVKDKSTNGVYKVLKGGVTVTYVKPLSKKSSVKIPDTIKIDKITCKVTQISPNALKNQSSLTSVTIGKNITSIGSNAFYKCKKLKSITIKTSLLSAKKTGSKAFTGIYSKPTVRVPSKKLSSYKKIFKTKGMPAKAVYKK